MLQFVTCVKIQTTYRYVHKQIRNYIIEGHENESGFASYHWNKTAYKLVCNECWFILICQFVGFSLIILQFGFFLRYMCKYFKTGQR